MSNVVDMRAQLASAALPSPVLTASGCAAAGRELDRFFDVTAIGAVVTKSIMASPRSGRPTPRMAETPAGMLNSIGLQGPGVEEFIRKDLRWLRERGARTVVSIAGGSVNEFAELANRLRHEEGISAIEVNISCPNVESRGQVFACDARAAGSVIHAVRRPEFGRAHPKNPPAFSYSRAGKSSRKRRLADARRGCSVWQFDAGDHEHLHIGREPK